MKPIEQIMQMVRAALREAGASPDDVERLALSVEDQIRETFGASQPYIHSTDLVRRNQALRNAWNSALLRNAKLPRDQRAPMAVLRDQVCNDHGITRRTLTRILGSPIATDCAEK